MRKNFSAKIKVEAFKRSGGRCESCGAKLFPGHYQFDHVVADGLTGLADLSNCAVLCSSCHSKKTSNDVVQISKAKRRERNHIGAKTPKGRPIMGSRRSGWRKRMDGTVERRR